MRITRLRISNILGVESLDVAPGTVTFFEGRNGAGKTSVLESIMAALGGGRRAHLVREGADEGEVVLELDGDVTVTKRFLADGGYDLEVLEGTRKVRKPQAYLSDLFDSLSMNPVEFILAEEKRRVSILLDALPLTISRQEITDRIGDLGQAALGDLKPEDERHALTMISAIARWIFDDRTGLNRAAKEKRATAEETTKALPAGEDDVDWGAELETAESDKRLVETDYNHAREALKDEAAAQISALRDDFDAVKAASDARIEEARRVFEALKAAEEATIAETHKRFMAAKDEAQAQRDEQLAEMEREHKARYEPAVASVKECQAQLEVQRQHAATREFIAKMSREADELERQAVARTEALAKLEELRGDLLERLPIKGLSIQDGQLFVKNKPFERLSTSEQIRLALEIARLRAGDLGLVCVDKLEHFDSEQLAAFEAVAATSGLQFLCTRVEEGELRVRTSS